MHSFSRSFLWPRIGRLRTYCPHTERCRWTLHLLCHRHLSRTWTTPLKLYTPLTHDNPAQYFDCIPAPSFPPSYSIIIIVSQRLNRNMQFLLCALRHKMQNASIPRRKVTYTISIFINSLY